MRVAVGHGRCILSVEDETMHGIIFAELKKYVDAKLGSGVWSELLETAGLGPRMYLAIQAYPDEEVVDIVTAASKKTGLAVGVILGNFGEFIAPDLLGMYKGLVEPHWRTLETIENTENTIHKVVRMQHSEATPPYLSAVRTGTEEVTVTYNSPRRLCQVAKGIMRGMAVHFDEVIIIDEKSCMHKRAAACVMVVTRVTDAIEASA